MTRGCRVSSNPGGIRPSKPLSPRQLENLNRFEKKPSQAGMERLLRAVGGADERRQAAEFEKIADHAHARAALRGDAPVRSDQDPAQPRHALGRLDEGRQRRRCRVGRSRIPVMQGAARHAGAADCRALTLPILLRLRHRLPMRGAIQAIMAWPGASICTRVNAGRGIGQRYLSRSVCTSKGTPPRRSCHSFRVLDRLPKHPVLDQPMIKAPTPFGLRRRLTCSYA